MASSEIFYENGILIVDHANQFKPFGKNEQFLSATHCLKAAVVAILTGQLTAQC